MSQPDAMPRIWRVLGDKRGDNAQVEIIAEALARERGWVSELRHLEMLPKFVVGKPRVGPTLYHIDQSLSGVRPMWRSGSRSNRAGARGLCWWASLRAGSRIRWRSLT